METSEDGYSEPQWLANKREFMLDERERIANERERIADERERLADEREGLADQRYREASFAIGGGHRQPSIALAERSSSASTRQVARQAALLALDAARDAVARDGYVQPLNAQFALLARRLYGSKTIGECLDDIVEYAKRLAQCESVSVSVVDGGVVRTKASTGPIAALVDDLQYRNGEGPCLQAIRDLTTITSGDLRVDDRWPTFGPLASDEGVLSALSVCMYLEADTTERYGSLNHYAADDGAFADVDGDLAVILAAHAAIAIASLQTRHEYEGLQTALQTRDIIGQAKGILMERGKITADQAFDVLRRGSQLLNRRLRDIADEVAHTGEFRAH